MSKKKINRIFLLGDSWIEGQGIYQFIEDGIVMEPNLPFGPEKVGGINEWRRKNSWNKFFKEEYGDDIDIINLGRQGADNTSSFELLNWIIKEDYKDTDLILYGFTSKYRDSHDIRYHYTQPYSRDWRNPTTSKTPKRNKFDTLLHKSNPILQSPLSFEKLQIARQLLNKNNEENVFMGKEEFIEDKNIPNDEKEFSMKWIQDFFIEIFDEKVYDNIASANYMFYQKYSKWKGINILFFDLFEPYVNPKSVSDLYNVDTNIYINYNKKTFRDILVDYEFDNFKTSDIITIWEKNNTFPCLSSENLNKGDRYSGEIFHPNQHGYKVLFDYLVENYLNKNYQIESKPKL